MDALSPLYVGKKGSAAESLMFENHSHEKSLPEPKYGPGPSQDACWCPCFPAIRLREVSPLSPQTLGTSILLFFVFVELLIPQVGPSGREPNSGLYVYPQSQSQAPTPSSATILLIQDMEHHRGPLLLLPLPKPPPVPCHLLQWVPAG